MPLFWISLAFLVGVILSDLFSLPLPIWLGLAVVAAAAFWCTRQYARQLSVLAKRFFLLSILKFPDFSLPLPTLILLSVLFLGAARFQSTRLVHTSDSLANYNDVYQKVIIEGTLVEPAEVMDGLARMRVRAEKVRPEDTFLFELVEGDVQVSTTVGKTWRYGDRVRLEGYLKTPPETEAYSYREYLARHGVYSLMQSAKVQLLLPEQKKGLRQIAYRLREKAFQIVYRLYPDPEASLLAGILLGIESGISLPLEEAFIRTGTAHIIAISGFNFSVLAGFLIKLFRRLLGRWRGAFAALIAIAFYTILVGGSAAVVRAAIMGGLGVFSSQVGRRQHGLNSLAFIAALMALFDPNVLWDIGFQLSVGATLGLILFSEPITQGFVALAKRWIPEPLAVQVAGPVGEFFLFTFAAQVMTLPITVYYFGRISISALIANPLVLPVQPAVMILGGLSILVGLVIIPLGQLVAWLAWPFLLFTVRIVESLGAFPGGEIRFGQVAFLVIVIYYLLVLSYTFTGKYLRNWLTGQHISIRPALPLALVLVLATLIWRDAQLAPDERLHIILLDVCDYGRCGEAVLIQTPTGRNLLINGGASATRLSASLGRRLPLFDRKLDFLIVAANQDEQLAALPSVLTRFPIEQVLWAGPTHASRSSRLLYEALINTDVPWQSLQAGQAIDLGEGASLQTLTVGNRGGSFLLTWQNFRMLMPFGIDFDDIDTLDTGQAIGSVSALILADSGYAATNQPTWLATLNPQVVLLSVSATDTSGRPSPETLTALEGYSLLRTDRNGWIHLATDGKHLWVEVERK